MLKTSWSKLRQMNVRKEKRECATWKMQQTASWQPGNRDSSCHMDFGWRQKSEMRCTTQICSYIMPLLLLTVSSPALCGHDRKSLAGKVLMTVTSHCSWWQVEASHPAPRTFYRFSQEWNRNISEGEERWGQAFSFVSSLVSSLLISLTTSSLSSFTES